MKKIAVLVAVLALVLCSCNKDRVSKNYAGVYKGTYQFNFPGRTQAPKEGKIPVISNPASVNGVLIYDVIPLEVTDVEGVYSISTEQTSLLSAAFGAIGINPSTTEEVIKGLKLKADFTDAGSLSMTLSYEVEILASMTTELRIIEFNGSKQ